MATRRRSAQAAAGRNILIVAALLGLGMPAAGVAAPAAQDLTAILTRGDRGAVGLQGAVVGRLVQGQQRQVVIDWGDGTQDMQSLAGDLEVLFGATHKLVTRKGVDRRATFTITVTALVDGTARDRVVLQSTAKGPPKACLRKGTPVADQLLPAVQTGENELACMVAQLYADVLHREATGSEIKAMVAELGDGSVRLPAVQRLLASPGARQAAVQDLYRRFLHRAPSPAELTAGLALLAGGGTANDLGVTLLGSPEYFTRHDGDAAGFVGGLYQDLLGRSIVPTEPLASALIGLLSQAFVERTGAAGLALFSAEARTRAADQLYRTFLHRPAPFAGGFGPQVGAGDAAIIAVLVASDEYVLRLPAARLVPPFARASESFVRRVYEDLLGRPIDPTGLVVWTGLIDQHLATRTQVGLALATSVEYRARLVGDLYQRYLGRAADPPGLTAFVQQLAAGGTVDQVKASLLGSDEYFAGHGGGTVDGFLAALYQDVLGRAIDPGAQSTLGALIGLLRREDVAAVVLASTEGKTVLLDGLYQALLGRNPSPAELGALLPAVHTGMRDEQVVASIVGSQEYLAQIP